MPPGKVRKPMVFQVFRRLVWRLWNVLNKSSWHQSNYALFQVICCLELKRLENMVVGQKFKKCLGKYHAITSFICHLHFSNVWTDTVIFNDGMLKEIFTKLFNISLEHSWTPPPLLKGRRTFQKLSHLGRGV